MATTSGPQDQRKRTLEALERRFTVAKAELLQQEKKNKKISTEEDRNGNFSIITSVANASSAPSSNSSLMKDVEENSRANSQLSEPVHENLLSANSNLSNKKGSKSDKILYELLQSGDSAQKYKQGFRSVKVNNWILLDNFVQGKVNSSGSQIRALKNHCKRSKRRMSMKQLKKSGVFKLPQPIQMFDAYKPMHEMWKGYMDQLLKITGKNQLARCLIGADLHGALIVECKIMSFNGVNGIMIRETAETFGIITHNNKFQVVPKMGSVLIFQVGCWKITLHGDKLTSRNLVL